MPDLNFDNVDTVKAFATILLGSALAAVLLYIYFRTVRPSLVAAIGTPRPTTPAGAVA